MIRRWAVCFPQSGVRAALPLRLHSGIKACAQDGDLWLTGDGDPQAIESLLKRIPDLTRYTVDSTGAVTRQGRRIPEGELPAGPWHVFSGVAQLQPQAAALPGRASQGVAVRLVRAATEAARPTALIVSIQAWLRYAITAPQVRLNALKFAVCADGRALIVGSPLPAIFGPTFVNHSGLLIPSGYQFQRDLEAQIIRRTMPISLDDFALFNVDSSYEPIAAENFVSASRSAVRRSAGAL